MTLILVLPTRDGIVMASDGQVTVGMVRTTGQKILRLNDRCLWAASGELALIQRVEERLKTLPPNASLQQLRDQICGIVKQCVTELLLLDFRTDFLLRQPSVLLELHPGDFVFAECLPSPAVLHVLVNGTPEWVTNRPFASGSGDMFAYALLQKYQGLDLDMEKGALLAYKVLEEAIAVGAYGLGPPIDIWKISNSGIKQLDDSEKAALEDASRTLREGEIQLLMGEIRAAKENAR
jgi:20S proteasome alpha/beta subunit